MSTEPSDSATLSLIGERPNTQRSATPTPHLFLALECGQPLQGASRYSLKGVRRITIGRGHERALTEQSDEGGRILKLTVPDSWMSSSHAQLERDGSGWILEDLRSKNGTTVKGIRQERATLSDGDLFELGKTFFIFRDGLPTAPDDPAVLDSSRLAPSAPGLGTLLPPLSKQFAALGEVARSGVSVVVLGESGTGKELIARGVHTLSGRSGAFVAVNCGALPDSILLSELFGYKKGAFSGALEDRSGLIRAADHGTLFLDEIGDLPAASQAAFLRVLQEREVTPVGGTRAVPVNLRLVAATHRDLSAQAAKGNFRADLLARLSGYTVNLPPLKARREDLGLLIAALLPRVSAHANAVTFSCEAARVLFRHDWPLNVRELEKALTTAVVLAQGGRIEEEHLAEVTRGVLREHEEEPVSEEAAARPLTDEDARRRDELLALLKEHQGNISAVARAMGKARMQIQRWVKRYRIDARDLQ